MPALTHQEVTQIVYELLIAGHETTTGLMGNALRRVLTERHAWEEICQEPSLIPNAIEEVLRFDSSVIAWRRKTTEAVEIGGVSVPADANLLLLLGSANRDPAVFEDPDHFDIHRQNAKEHLSFGSGVAFLPGGAAGAPRDARGAGGTERTPAQPAPGPGTDAAVPAQHHVPWTARAPGRVGHLTMPRVTTGLTTACRRRLTASAALPASRRA